MYGYEDYAIGAIRMRVRTEAKGDTVLVVTRVKALCPVRKLKGSSQSYVFDCDDGRKWAVKFYDGSKLVALEYFGNELAQRLHLPVPEHAIVDIEEDVIRKIPDLQGKNPIPGPHHGTLYLETAFDLQDHATPNLDQIVNGEQLPGVLVYDTLTCKTDTGSQNHLLAPTGIGYSYYMIDLGGILTGNWSAQVLSTTISSRNLTSNHPILIHSVTKMDVFEPTLQLVENLERTDIEAIVSTVPSEWGLTDEEKVAVVDFITTRKSMVREILVANKGNFSL